MFVARRIAFSIDQVRLDPKLYTACNSLLRAIVVSASLVVALTQTALGQAIERQMKTTIVQDSTVLDSNSIVPESFQLLGLDTTMYEIDFGRARLILKEGAPKKPFEVDLRYQTFSFNFTEPFANKSQDLITTKDIIYNPFRSSLEGQPDKLVDLGDLEKRGSVSRGISVGNNQSLGVNSSLNLQLSGRLNERFSLLAAIADNNVPIQPEGNTQQLQDFDQVYLQVYDPKNRITAGDFQTQHNAGYFLRFNKRLQGGRYETQILPVKSDTSKRVKVDVSGAVSRGKFARQTIQGIEGNQGPYRLSGAEGERFVVVLSGTERIYLDGRLLVRGQENDYIINYNTAELIFTAKVPITKDRRIVAEYQYSDRNYARSMVYSGTEYTSKRLDVNLGLYSEQDSKNQPLQQELTDNQKNVLRSIGDSLNDAVASSIDTAEFRENQLLYRLKDSTYFDPVLNDSITVTDILEFSSNPELANRQATFSEVGQGNGDYVRGPQLAFGRVYTWVAPIGGVPQGNYAPVILLVTPKQRQMVTLGAQYRINENITATAEWAGSQYDVNTFSSADKSDDLGMAAKVNVGGSQPISDRWKVIGGLDYEHVNQNFEQIERFRTVEFDRDWNIRALNIEDDQNILGAQLGMAQKDGISALYGVKSFNAQDAFNGVQNSVDINSDWKRLKGFYSGSLINQAGDAVKADFYQHNSLAVLPIWKVQLGFKDDFEQNKRYHPIADTLNNLSYQFWEWEASIANEDSAINRHKLSYAERTDWLKDSSLLSKATFARIYGYEMAINKMKQSRLAIRVNYRTLDILDTTLTTQERENTILSRLEYSFRAFKGVLSSSTFYEIGSGLENRREFIFLETTPGQGTHIHVDYNNNGVKELDEFEQAIQADQIASANYIKVFVPTNDYIRAFTNQFSQTLFLRPAAIWKSKSGVRKVVSRFSDQFTYSSDRKNLEIAIEDQFNPFLFDIADTALQSINSNLRNIFYFNQSDPIFGAEFNYQRINGRNFLTSGFESRLVETTGLGFRWNFATALGLESRAEQGSKIAKSNAGALSNRNYNIFFQQIEPKLNIQPGTLWRVSVLFNYKEQSNRTTAADGSPGERSYIRKTGAEFNLSTPEKGSLLVNANLIQINYTGAPESPVGFEMLDGLQPGLNATWGVSYQRTLANNLQLSLNYNGRQSPGIPVIHTGGVEARAFF
ncbi:MAG: hypothetical protein Salg2KO_11280 [Salibacteraceae bacterium]